MIFNKEDKMENERLKAEIENYQAQIKMKTMEIEQLKEQYKQKSNDLFDLTALAFNSFRKIVETAERNDFGDKQQKIRKMKEQAEDSKNYFANLTMNTPIVTKNRTITTYQSNK